MPQNKPKGATVSVIIPVLNNWELTEACLQSLAQYKTAVSCEIIVVDNASDDETPLHCPVLGKKLFGEAFRFLRQPHNLNFAGACNSGGHKALGEYLFFLNNDTMVTQGWLEPLLESFRLHNNVAAVGPLLLYPALGTLKDRVQHAGVALNPVMQVLHLYEGLPCDHKIISRTRATQVITAAALLIPKALFFAHNGFNEAYVNGFEDVDLCARLWAAGYAMVVEPASKIYHLQSQTPGRHTSDRENGTLLAQTSLPLLIPDMHTHLHMDGLELGLSDWLTFYPKMPAKMEQMLSTRFLRAGNEEHIAHLLQQEPFWYEGYAWLATQLEAQGNWKEAFSWRLVAAKLKPAVSTILPLLATAMEAGENHCVRGYISSIAPLSFPLSFFVDTATSILQSSVLCEIDTVTEQCKAWLARQDSFNANTIEPAIQQLSTLKKLTHNLHPSHSISYTTFAGLNKKLQAQKGPEIKERLQNLPAKPLLSILMPVCNPRQGHLEAAISSVLQQIYPNWELCIADDASKNPYIRSLLKMYAEKESRIKVTFREENGHISAASNSALALVSGDYTLLMDQDDLLPRHALLEVASALNKNPDAMLLYSDEDAIDDQETYSRVHYKHPFDPDFLCSQNYFSHLGVYKTSLLREVGGFREGFEGSQDHDLVLRCMEKVQQKQVIHIPDVLYHWRLHLGSTSMSLRAKPYAQQAGIRAVQDHFTRTGRNATVEYHPQCGHYKIMDALPHKLPFLSLIVTSNQPCDATLFWAEQFLRQTSYPCLELLLLQSDKAGTSAKDPRIRYVTAKEDEENNLAPALHLADGDIIGHIQAGLLPYENVWLGQIVAGLARPQVGVVGGRIFTAQNTLASAGFGITNQGLIYPHFVGIKREDDFGYYYQHGFLRNVFMCAEASFFAKTADFKRYYCEEFGSLWPAEFCMSIRQEGLRVLCSPEADLYHHPKFPTSTRAEYAEQALALFTQKWGHKTNEHALHPMLTPASGGYSLTLSRLL